MFIDNDFIQINERGSDINTVQEQVGYFENGFPFLQLSKAATVGDGIIRLTEEQIEVAYQ
jgi:Zn-dependent M28 family amino/carboxypeptidase